MSFRFALAPLLRLRQSIERQRTLALQEALLQVARARETLAGLERFLADSALADAHSLAAGRRAAELQFATLLREQLRQFRLQLQEEVRRLEEVRQRAQQAYEQAFREREVLETLRARQRREYQLEQARHEQQQLDAVYLLQRWRNRKA